MRVSIVPTLLHISDLHRTPDPRLSNEELFAAIASDAARWDNEGIPRPDLIVVSGDLIQGSSIDAPDSDSEIADQYVEARDFLQRLATEFVDSDRSRVIIVPGNHDVHWGRARRAMKPLIPCPKEIESTALSATSKVRWDWREQKAYEISDSDLYESHFEHFRRFQAEFYAGLGPNPLLHCDGVLVPFVPEYSNEARSHLKISSAARFHEDHMLDVEASSCGGSVIGLLVDEN